MKKKKNKECLENSVTKSIATNREINFLTTVTLRIIFVISTFITFLMSRSPLINHSG
jgi:hypothetical protein